MLWGVAFPVLAVVPIPEPCGEGQTELLLPQEDPLAGSWLAEWAGEVTFLWAPARDNDVSLQEEAWGRKGKEPPKNWVRPLPMLLGQAQSSVVPVWLSGGPLLLFQMSWLGGFLCVTPNLPPREEGPRDTDKSLGPAAPSAAELESLGCESSTCYEALTHVTSETREVGMQGFPGGRAGPGVQMSAPHAASHQPLKKPQNLGPTDRRSHTFQRNLLGPETVKQPGNKGSPIPDPHCPLCPLLTCTRQPCAEGPDNFGAPEPLEAGPHVPVVPLQGAPLHDSAGGRSSGPRLGRGRTQPCRSHTRAHPFFSLPHRRDEPGPQPSGTPGPPVLAYLARWQGRQSQPSSGWAWLQPWQVKRWQSRHCLLGAARSR